MATKIQGRSAIGLGPAAAVSLTPSRRILDRLARQACEIVGVERVTVMLCDEPDGRTAVPVAGHTVAGHGLMETLLGPRSGIDEDLAVRALESNRPVSVNRYYKVSPAVRRHGRTDPLDAAVAVPIRSSGQARGALSAATTSSTREFGPRELEALSELADLAAVALEHADMREQLDRTVRTSVEVLAADVAKRDGYTGRHSEQVIALACRVGERLRLDPRAIAEVEFAARLHDLGKIGVPDSVLQKPGPLSMEEWEIIRRHPEWGAEMLARVPGLDGVAGIVLRHHERIDGTGYPDGLAGDEIPVASRIISACDAFQAMVSDRPYRRALGREAAMAELHAGSGGQFDPAAVEAVADTTRAAVELSEHLSC